MIRDFTSDLGWARQYDRYIRAILGQVFIKAAEDFQDQHEATDFDMVYTMRPLTFACRLRTAGWLVKRPFDVTIRSQRPSGVSTEWQKIVAGFGDFFFYGFAAEIPPQVTRWLVIDLERLRMADLNRLLRFKEIPNHDQSSSFRVLHALHLRKLGCIYTTSPQYWPKDGWVQL